MDNQPTNGSGAKNQRVPPHSFVAEEALLGAMLLSADAVADVEGLVEPGHFYRSAHARVYEAVVAIARRGGKADAVLVLEALDQQQRDAIGGLEGLLALEMNTPATSNASQYAETVRECAMRRRLIETCQEMIHEAFEGPCDSAAVIDRSREQFLAQDSTPGSLTAVPLYDSLDSALTTLENIDEGRGPRGAPTGFPDIDSHLRGGLSAGGLYVIGARPAMGKSLLAAEIALNVASSSGPVLLATLEMTHEDTALRLMSSRGRIDANRMFESGKTDKDWHMITNAISQLKDAPLFLMDHSGTTVADLRRAARRVRVTTGGLSLIVVDYLQLMGSLNGYSRSARPETRQLEIAEITRALKVMAGEMKCPVVAVSQLNRAVELRSDKRPNLSDLRESGTIEQDADVVMLLYRDEVYKPDDLKTQGTAELHIAKNRHGPEARVKLTFMSRFTAFVSAAPGGLRTPAL